MVKYNLYGKISAYYDTILYDTQNNDNQVRDMKIQDSKNRISDSMVIGIDIGSTTAKVVVIDKGEMVYSRYERHFSQVRRKTLEMIEAIADLLSGRSFTVAVSGSAGLGMAAGPSGL